MSAARRRPPRSRYARPDSRVNARNPKNTVNPMATTINVWPRCEPRGYHASRHTLLLDRGRRGGLDLQARWQEVLDQRRLRRPRHVDKDLHQVAGSGHAARATRAW